MITSIQGVSKIYSILLRLFPRDFQKEFREKIEDVSLSKSLFLSQMFSGHTQMIIVKLFTDLNILFN